MALGDRLENLDNPVTNVASEAGSNNLIEGCPNFTASNSLNHPQNLVSLYRKFYRAQVSSQFYKSSSARKIIQPLYEANEIICRYDFSLASPENLTQSIAGHVAKLMERVRSTSETLGYWVIQDRVEERQAILKFASYLVNEVFYNSFNGDLARFSGKQRGYLEDTCEFLYRLADDAERAAQKDNAKTEEASPKDTHEVAGIDS